MLKCDVTKTKVETSTKKLHQSTTADDLKQLMSIIPLIDTNELAVLKSAPPRIQQRNWFLQWNTPRSKINPFYPKACIFLLMQNILQTNISRAEASETESATKQKHLKYIILKDISFFSDCLQKAASWGSETKSFISDLDNTLRSKGVTPVRPVPNSIWRCPTRQC
ncbi:hypothetical protein EVAR_58978_1 [Eumeta japonica]|uniref:Uncharacterized protein n=1 Tax=Eumeta variegata TaxID=151549 RepID=A0A4C1YJ94_EUMVA|nr:hypothetical protein EVAR_58978_1 [Eumeta japonica]